MGDVLVGTSGYDYPHFRGVLYPPGLPHRAWLAHYAACFPTVELNATFYRLPTPASVDRWREETPEGFRFACKGSRFLTHMKLLLEVGEGLRRYFRLVRRLGPKLGPVLWQLPPRWTRPDPQRLETFLAALPEDVRHAVEFRHEAWYTRAIARVLDRHGVAFCEHDLVDARHPGPTGGFRYLRFHGARAPHAGRYGGEALRPVARRLAAWVRRGDAYVYFNNDAQGHAVRDAWTLSAFLGVGSARGHRALAEARHEALATSETGEAAHPG